MEQTLRGQRYYDYVHHEHYPFILDPEGNPGERRLSDDEWAVHKGATKRVCEYLAKKPLLDLPETLAFYRDPVTVALHDAGKALLACNDRFYLLTQLIGREDLIHPWLYERVREVEAEPYGHVDLWARYHGKSSIITFGGIVQDVLCEPETTICIFSVTKDIAREFLAQIKNEFESNEELKRIFPDVLYFNPRGKGLNGERPAKWSLHRGITVRRKGRPKEATVEAHGLIDGQPTGRHFNKHYYDDIVTQDHLTEEQLKKTAERYEMADHLGTRHGVDKSIAGTRYHFADVYGVILEKGSAKPRIYPATDDGTPSGQLVLLEPAQWEKIKKTQSNKIINSQMLLNPVAGNEATFRPFWLRSYDVIPRVMNVYILVDPSKGSTQRSDRTAIAVIGIDQGGSKYLLDGACHRMKLSDRWHYIKQFKSKWEKYLDNNGGIVRVGYERYGMQVDTEVLETKMVEENNYFEIVELNTPRQGGESKNDRIERLEPDFRYTRFYLPAVVHHSDFGPKDGPFAGRCYWSVWTEEDALNARRLGQDPKFHIGQIIYREMKGLTKRQREHGERRIVQPLRLLNENKEAYDLTRVFIEEFLRHPFASHDDMLDATSRIFDIEPIAPVPMDAKSTESIEVDDRGIDHNSSGDID